MTPRSWTCKGLAGTGKGVLLTHQDALTRSRLRPARTSTPPAIPSGSRKPAPGDPPRSRAFAQDLAAHPERDHRRAAFRRPGRHCHDRRPNGSTLWTQTTSIILKGLSAGYVIPAGTKLYFTATNSATAAAVQALNPATKSSSGRTKVVTVVNSVTAGPLAAPRLSWFRGR